MTGKSLLFLLLLMLVSWASFGQVDTTYIYNNGMPYGTLDIRLATSSTAYYYLQENKTFSFRENAGVHTDTYLDMTSSWDSSPYQQGNLRFTNGTTDNFVMNYRFLKPVGYTPTYDPGYPLLLILHGLGESANCSERDCYHGDATYSPVTNTPAAPTDPLFELLNNDHHLTNGGRAHLKAVNDAAGKLPNDPSLAARAFPGFVVFPQNLNGWNGAAAQDAIRIVRLMAKKYKIDPNRIYIHGLSNGGQGVYETIKRAPWMFAAALTMSPISDGNINNQGAASLISRIPQWVFQGGLDIRPTPQKTESMIRKFRDAGAFVRYTVYPNLGHGTWATAYNEPDFFQWILGKNNTQLHAFSGNATICGAGGLKLELPSGFFAYQWQLNGQTIANANGPIYSATTPGKYRARYSRVPNPTEAQWNPWSQEIDVKTGQALPQAEIIQEGTIVLRDLNNGNEAVLEAKGNYDRYFWYKNGVLVDFPGDQDDTVKRAVITSTMGAGSYTLINANYDNCQSAASAAKQLFFNDSAPINITAPTNFAGTISGGIETNLTWTDASTNEGGFEIWRRRKISETSFSPWQLVTITAANVSSYKDSGLMPTSTYEYKIRAVSASGRSNYSPSAFSLSVVTTTDTQKPTAPIQLSGAAVGVSKIKLAWKPSTDNGEIKDYIVRYNADSVVTNSTDTTFVLKNVPINENLNISVRSRDFAGNLSPVSNTIQASTYTAGLYYEHSTGATEDLDTINWDIAEFTGKVSKVTLSPKTQEDYFNFLFDGFIYITTAGSYQFRTGSDDGSRLALNGNAIVENDGVHNFKKVESAAQNLTAGGHRFTVWFFDFVQSDSLIAEYKGPDTNNEWREIPAEAFKSSDQVVTGVGPDDGPEDSFKVYVYPNPSSPENLNVKIETVSIAPVSIELLDPIGKRLQMEVLEPANAKEGFRLSPSSTLSPGIYFIRVTQENTTSRQRVIIKQ
jgi:hypothetical protein